MKSMHFGAVHEARLYSASVERHVKERLIGAAVLVAAAVILIPEMLSGPDEESTRAEVAAANESSLRTYTIDLSKTGPSSSFEATPSTASPPPEEQQAPAETSSQANPELTEAAPVAERTAAVIDPPAESPRETPPVAERPAAPTAPERSASAASAPVRPGSGWAVQLGSFSSRATADKLAAQWKAQGFDAFVMPVQSGANTLYRVRIGPVPDRDSAANVQQKIRASVPAAAVVKHP